MYTHKQRHWIYLRDRSVCSQSCSYAKNATSLLSSNTRPPLMDIMCDGSFSAQLCAWCFYMCIMCISFVNTLLDTTSLFMHIVNGATDGP